MIVLISFFTILAQILILILLWVYFTGERTIGSFAEKYALLLTFLTGLGSMAGALYFSEVLGFAPCVLCWYQRYFMIPAILVLGVALWKGYNLKKLIMALIAGGLAIALYQNYGLWFNLSALPCGVEGGTVSCAKVYFTEFGYITIPVMSLTSFLLMGVLMLFHKRV